jgi:TetR/AcrR family transcriptional regulator
LGYITNPLVINIFVSTLPLSLNPAIDSSVARRERRKEARPGELLAAALDLFVEKGFAATRSEEVAQRAGVSKGTLFLYFPTKEDLFKAVVRENISSKVHEGFDEIEKFPGSSADLVAYLLNMWWERFGSTKASGLTKLMMSEATNFPELASFYHAEVIEPNQRLIRSVIQRGIDAGEFRQVDMQYAVYTILAPMIYLVTWKHSMGCCVGNHQQIEPKRYLQTQIDMVVHALLASTPPRASHP